MCGNMLLKTGQLKPEGYKCGSRLIFINFIACGGIVSTQWQIIASINTHNHMNDILIMSHDIKYTGYTQCTKHTISWLLPLTYSIGVTCFTQGGMSN